MDITRLVEFVRPFFQLIPEIQKPDREIQFREKVLWTVITSILFLSYLRIPLYGIVSSDSTNRFYRVESIRVSKPGTLMDLGFSPIITSDLILTLFIAASIIKVGYTSEDRALLKSLHKVFRMITTIGQATVYIMAGIYGNPSEIGAGNCFLIIIQLFFADLSLLLFHELLSKGYGLGSGHLLYIAINICQRVVWAAFSPAIISTKNGTEFEGIITALVHVLATKRNKLKAVHQVFYRRNLPNLMNLLATVFAFVIVIYFESFRLDIPIKSSRYIGQSSSYPIKLLYTSYIPILIHDTLLSLLYFITEMLSTKFHGNFLTNLLGVWTNNRTQRSYLTSVLYHYLSVQVSFKTMFLDPVHTIVHIAFTLGSCAFISRIWIEISGTRAVDVAKQLKEAQMTMHGHREKATIVELNQYIPTAAVLSGLFIGALSLFAHLFGTIVGGPDILFAFEVIYDYFVTIVREQNELGDMETPLF